MKQKKTISNDQMFPSKRVNVFTLWANIPRIVSVSFEVTLGRKFDLTWKVVGDSLPIKGTHAFFSYRSGEGEGATLRQALEDLWMELYELDFDKVKQMRRNADLYQDWEIERAKKWEKYQQDLIERTYKKFVKMNIDDGRYPQVPHK